MWYDNTLYKEEETTSQKQQEVYTATNYFKQFGLGADKSELGVVKATIHDYGENK